MLNYNTSNKKQYKLSNKLVLEDVDRDLLIEEICQLKNVISTYENKISTYENYVDLDKIDDPLDYDNKDKLILEFLNKLLKNMKKEPITKITDFCYYRKDEIIVEENEQLVDVYLDKFLEHYTKKQLQYHKRTYVQCYFWCFFKAILGKKYVLKYSNRNKTKKVKTCLIYSIKKM